ncbi:MAG TPA: hypothetical protein PKY82_10920 [Pyrinomonadaceae bacterium]|nr:hypothetical protein [Pyrinomonadaceae bacterium]
MINKGQINAEELKIQGLLDRYLRVRSTNNNFNGNHLDEDSLTAFVEGKVNERESPNIIRHLVNCSFCLNVTGELAKLSIAFADDEVVVPNPTKEPMKISEVLGGIMSRIFGTNDGAVFAHEEREENEEDQKDQEEDKKAS